MLESMRGRRHPCGPRTARSIGMVFLPVSLVLLACDPSPISTHHQAYAEGLRESGLAELPAGAAWIGAGATALTLAEPAELPLHVEGFFAEDSATARAWWIPVHENQRVFVSARLEGRASGRLFVEVFEVPQDTADAPFAVASADDTTRVLEVETSRRADVLIVRLQPELLRGGRFELTVAADSPVDFARASLSTLPRPTAR